LFRIVRERKTLHIATIRPSARTVLIVHASIASALLQELADALV
jgi:hypothetical protein